jgi:hypothetical protein
MGSIHEKSQRPKISCYCTFKYVHNLWVALIMGVGLWPGAGVGGAKGAI